MSSITFPHAGLSLAASSNVRDSGFYDDRGSESEYRSSFQMNPHSSHPPRTPRPSHVSSSSQAFEFSTGEESHAQADAAVPPEPDEEEDGDQDQEKLRAAEKRVSKEEIWRDLLKTSNGRDKAFKLIQYSIRVYLLVHTSLTASRLLRRPTRPPWEVNIVKRLESTADGLSFTRKLLILFNWLPPLTAIMAQQSVPYSSEQTSEKSKKAKRPLLHAILYAPPPVLLELVHAFADDIATFSRLGLVGKRTGERAGRFSDWCWLLATLIGLVENSVERGMIGNLQQEVESRLYKESMTGATAKSKGATSKIDEKELGRLQRQDYWLQISRAKLVMDLIFASYDVFRIRRGRAPVQAFTGLSAAILSSAKLYDRQKSALVKMVTF